MRFSKIAAAARASTLDAREPFLAALAGAHTAATSPRNTRKPPTEAQMRAGNYLMGPVKWQGHRLHIENPAHTVREGEDARGKPWRNIMQAHYGYFVGTRGADGDGIDVFLGPYPESRSVWVLNQTDEAGEFDEHKVLVGFIDERAAVDAYRLSYTPGWDRFKPPVRLTFEQLRWWLAYADTTRELTTDLVPPEPDMDLSQATPDLSRVLWDSAAMPSQPGATLSSVLYDIRVHDAADGLVLDPLTMADIMDGAEVLKFDALVTLAGRLQPKMQALLRIMDMAGTEAVKPLAFQISEPLRRYGGAHVAVLFELSDGQTITIWLHNPDSTPAKLTPADELVSWKWMLNKKDITIVVAPESGQDLNLREVARRLMRLAAKNSAAFQRANAKRTETMAEIANLKEELATKQGELTALVGRIEVAKIERDDRTKRAAAGPAWKQRDFDPTTPAGWWAIKDNEDALLYWQDKLDSFFQERIVAVRNALRDLGWEGDRGAPLTFNGATLGMTPIQVGAGRNVVGVKWFVTGNLKSTALRSGNSDLDVLLDNLEATPAEIAAELHADVALPAATPQITPGAPDYVEWEDALTSLVEERDEATRSDAQGMLEAQDMMNRGILKRLHSEGVTPEDAYTKLFGAAGGDPFASFDAWKAAVVYALEQLGDTAEKAAARFNAREADMQATYAARMAVDQARDMLYFDKEAPQADDPVPAADWNAWIEAITAAVESRLGATRSDAQGMVEAKDAELRKLFAAGYNHETAYASVFADRADPKPTADPAVTPAPIAELPDNVFENIEPEAFALVAQNPKAYATASAIETAVTAAGAAVSWVMTTREPEAPIFDSLFELDGARFVRGDITFRAVPVGSVTVNGAGEAFFTDTNGEPFNPFWIADMAENGSASEKEQAIANARDEGLLGWTTNVDRVLEGMLSVQVLDPISETIDSKVNAAENATGDAEIDDAGGMPSTILDRGNEHWKRTLNDASEGARPRSARIGLLIKGGRQLIATAVYKGTSRADWYVVLALPAVRKSKEQIPFPAIRGSLKMGVIAAYLMGYLDADGPSGWRMVPPDASEELLKQTATETAEADGAWTKGLVTAEGLRGIAGGRDFAVDVYSERDYQGERAIIGATLERNGVKANLEWKDGSDSYSLRSIGDRDGEFLSSGGALSEVLDNFVKWQDTLPVQTESAEVAFLREVKAGAHDALALGDMLAKIEASIQALSKAGALSGEAETVANEAITRWVELDEKANG